MAYPGVAHRSGRPANAFAVSGARLREELIPLLMEKDPRPAFQLLSQWGALSFLIPNLKWEKSHDAFFGQLIRQSDKENTLLLRLLVLVHAIPFPKAVGSLGHLMFPQKMIEQIELALTLLAQMKEGRLSLSDMPKKRQASAASRGAVVHQ